MNVKNFETQIREVFGEQYVKVFLKNEEENEKVQKLLMKLDGVKTVNITPSESKDNPKMTLTVYPKKVFSAEEVEESIKAALSKYFNN
ncbi:MAG: hypothetical protein IJ681_04110 [Bacteroidales bacterium]|nr:hypothetical protein [Bacteroidales bacterium]